MRKFQRKGRRFKVGQVVCLDKLSFYTAAAKRCELYQRITKVSPWLGFGGDELTLANGDRCHESWVRRLNDKERGR